MQSVQSIVSFPDGKFSTKPKRQTVNSAGRSVTESKTIRSNSEEFPADGALQLLREERQRCAMPRLANNH